AIAPEELRRRQFAALTGWTIASARVQPLVLVFEDLHWADPTTLEVFRGLASGKDKQDSGAIAGSARFDDANSGQARIDFSSAAAIVRHARPDQFRHFGPPLLARNREACPPAAYAPPPFPEARSRATRRLLAPPLEPPVRVSRCPLWWLRPVALPARPAWRA